MIEKSFGILLFRRFKTAVFREKACANFVRL